MMKGKIPGKAELPLMTLVDVAAWEAETPLDESVVFCYETKTFWYYTLASGAVDIGAPVTEFETEFFPSAGDTSIPPNTALVNRTIIGFYREGIKKRVVLGAPASADWVGYDHTDGSFVLKTGDVFGLEWISIVYTLLPTAV